MEAKESQQSNQPSQNHDNKKILLSVLLLISAVGLFWFGLREEDETNLEDEMISLQKNEELVNNHLRKTVQKIESQKINAQIENYIKAPKLNEGAQIQSYEASSHSLDFKSDPRIDDLTATLGKNKKASEAPKGPKEIIHGQLYDQQKWNDYKLSYRQAYAQKYVEKAKREGWEVTLNDEYKIIRTKPIKKDNRPKLFRDVNSVDSGNSTNTSSSKSPN